MDPEFGMKWVGDHLISLREVNNSKNIKKVYVYLCIGRGKRNKMRLSLSDIVVVLLGDGPALAQEGEYLLDASIVLNLISLFIIRFSI